MTIDQAARDAITSGALHRTLFVEAGAGTGKTSQLVNRITNLVTDSGVPLSDIAAITFTDAAAAELRDRVRSTFERRLSEAFTDLERERCHRALAEIDQAAISTLHGFAQRILSENPVQSGLPPRIGVLDEVSSTLERDDRWERFADRLYDDPANDQLLVRAAVLDIAVERRYPNQRCIQDVAVALGNSWDRLAPVATIEHGPLPSIDLSAFDRAVDDLAALPDRCSDHHDLFYCRLTESILPEMQAVVAIEDPIAKLRALTSAGWSPGRGGKNQAWSGDAKAARQMVADVVDAAKVVVRHASHEVLVRLMTLVARDLIDASEARRREGRLEFHDLLVFAERLLVDSPVARSRLHDRYTHLLLDEFQDTDPLQIRLAVLIAASVVDGPVGHWSEITVEEGRLFFVGDPKQSIYRFRRADISLFLAARDRFGAGDALARLSTNFRTVAPVIDWINAVFTDLMPAEIPDAQPRYEPLHAHRQPPEGVDHRPVVVGGPHDAGRAADVRAAEAADVAAVIDSVRRQPQRWLVHDEREEGWRPARLGDVTVLIPTRTELEALRSALDERGVPFHLRTGTLVYGTQEVLDALAVLRAVDDPGDELSLVAALRSPLYACSDVDLFTFRAAGGRWDLRSAGPTGLDPDHPVVAGLAHLRTLWERRWWCRPSELLATVLHERQAFVLAFGADRPEESWGYLRFLLDQARHFDAGAGGDLRDFLRWADLQQAEDVSVHDPVGAGSDDMVQIMTIHGSKGLEFPIAVLSGMSAEPPNAIRGVNVIWGEDDMPEVSLRADRATLGHTSLVDHEKEMARHEQLRLLYVACTRARDHLVVSAHHKADKGSFADRLWSTSQDHPDTWRRVDVDSASEPGPGGLADPDTTVDGNRTGAAAGAGGTGAAEAEDRRRWVERRQALVDPQRTSRFISATAVAAAAGATDDIDADADEFDAESEVAVTEGSARGAGVVHRRGRAGTAIGRAVHGVLQHVDLGSVTSEALAMEAARQCEHEAIPELVRVVVATAESALESRAVSEAVGHRHHREVYVAAPVGDRVLEGYVDLLVETAEGLVVVDYKTDTVRSDADVDAKLAGYELQAAAYAVALEASTGLRVARCRFVFCRPGGAIERDVADLPAAMARVRSSVSGSDGPRRSSPATEVGS